MLTRAQFLAAAGGSVAGLLVRGVPAEAATIHRARVGAALRHEPAAHFVSAYQSRPDLSPPSLTISYPAGAPGSNADGYLFLAPTAKPAAQAGALIVDASGQPVWFNPAPPGSWVSNFRVQLYRGQPVLTYWQGIVRPPGYGQGEGVILDASYRQIARVRAQRGRQADLHEFLLTPQGTALITCDPQIVPADLSAVGGPPDGQAYESTVQEIDVRSGRLLFEWKSLRHIPIRESYMPLGETYDYLHVNSIDVMPDGNLLVSGRHTCALYKVDRRTGRVLWRLGGRRSDFAMRRGTRFNWQHDAQHLPGGQISVFDNGSGPRRTEAQSRGLVLQVDQRHRIVSLSHAYRHPTPLLTGAMGSVQSLPDGNVLVGWGLIPTISEFSAGGALVAELRFAWGYNCYRAYRMPWAGRPKRAPDLVARPGASSGTSLLYASWNGATGIACWQVSAGQSVAAMQSLGSTPRNGFETAIPIAASQGYAAVTAIDASGAALGSSAPVQL